MKQTRRGVLGLLAGFVGVGNAATFRGATLILPVGYWQAVDNVTSAVSAVVSNFQESRQVSVLEAIERQTRESAALLKSSTL